MSCFDWHFVLALTLGPSTCLKGGFRGAYIKMLFCCASIGFGAPRAIRLNSNLLKNGGNGEYGKMWIVSRTYVNRDGIDNLRSS